MSIACAPPPDVQGFQTEHLPLRTVTVASGLDHPWGLDFLPDGQMIVTERPGTMRLVTPDGVISAPLSGVPEVWASGQGGLLDVALAPDFETSRRIYFTYAEPGENGSAGTTAARAILQDSGITNVEVIFRQMRKVRSGVHFGSRIVFRRDGTLFITTGERGGRDQAQDLERHLGKVIRIHPDGRVPPDNPFVEHDNALPEIWSYGHRNLQGATLDADGRLWTVEHGARGGDELNRPQAGLNYGWPVITYGVDYSGARIGVGTEREGMEQPIYHWVPSIAPSGLLIYTGDAFPEWQGDFLVGSLKFGLLVRLDMDGGEVVHEERMLEGLNQRVRDVIQVRTVWSIC
jgi:glucose/arabinose dehydrogenase